MIPIEASQLLGGQISERSIPTGKRYVLDENKTELIEKQYGFWTRFFSGPKPESRTKNRDAANFLREKLKDLELNKNLYAGISQIATKQLDKLKEKNGLRLSGTSIQCVTKLANFCQKSVDDHLEVLKEQGYSPEVIKKIKERLHQEPKILGEASKSIGIGRWKEGKGGEVDVALKRAIVQAIDGQILPTIEDMADKHLHSQVEKLANACGGSASFDDSLESAKNAFECNPDLRLLDRTHRASFQQLFKKIYEDASKEVKKYIHENSKKPVSLTEESMGGTRGGPGWVANKALTTQVTKKTAAFRDELKSNNSTSEYAREHPVGAAVIQFAGSEKTRLVVMKPDNEKTEETIHDLACDQLKHHPGLQNVRDPKNEIEDFEKLSENLKKANPLTEGLEGLRSASAFSGHMNSEAGIKNQADCKVLCEQWVGIKKNWSLDGNSTLATAIRSIGDGAFYKECDAQTEKAKEFLALYDRVEEHAKKGISKDVGYELEWALKKDQCSRELHASALDFLQYEKTKPLLDLNDQETKKEYQAVFEGVRSLVEKKGLQNLGKAVERINQAFVTKAEAAKAKAVKAEAAKAEKAEAEAAKAKLEAEAAKAKLEAASKSQNISEVVKSRTQLLKEEGEQLVKEFKAAYENEPVQNIGKIGVVPKEMKPSNDEVFLLENINKTAIKFQEFAEIFTRRLSREEVALCLTNYDEQIKKAYYRLNSFSVLAETEITLPELNKLKKVGEQFKELKVQFSDKSEGDVKALTELQKLRINKAREALEAKFSLPANDLLPSLYEKSDSLRASKTLVGQLDNRGDRFHAEKCGPLLESTIDFLGDPNKVKTTHEKLREYIVIFLKAAREAHKLFGEIPELATVDPSKARAEIRTMRDNLIRKLNFATITVKKVQEYNSDHKVSRNRMAKLAEAITGKNEHGDPISKGVIGDGYKLIKMMEEKIKLLDEVETAINKVVPEK